MGIEKIGRKGFWLILACVVVIIAGVGGVKSDSEPSGLEQGMVNSQTVNVIPVQVGRDAYGVAMVDFMNETLWVYEINRNATSHNQLRLIAARSWRYDRQLKDYNTSEPTPEQVKDIIEKFAGQDPEK